MEWEGVGAGVGGADFLQSKNKASGSAIKRFSLLAFFLFPPPLHQAAPCPSLQDRRAGPRASTGWTWLLPTVVMQTRRMVPPAPSMVR